MTDIEHAIATVLAGQPHDPWDEEHLRSLVSDLARAECRNLAEKLLEAPAAKPGRFENLIGELRVARLVSRQLAMGLTFNVGNAADIQFNVDGCECLLEVVHKSAPSAFSAVFNPTPADLQHYTNGSAWQKSALALHELITSLPVTVQPWVTAEFVQPQIGWKARAAQESACGELAAWLIEQLPGAVVEGKTKLRYSDGQTYFELATIDAAPGYMCGHACLEAWFGSAGELRESIERKNRKARERLAATEADVYLVGLAVDDAWLSRGSDLETTLLGPMTVTDRGRRYRPVPASRRARIEDARRLGREDLLQLARFDPTESNLAGFAEGVFFDPASEHVGGVIAIYYTDSLQFVPNPFSSNNIDPLRFRFPSRLSPFAPQ